MSAIECTPWSHHRSPQRGLPARPHRRGTASRLWGVALTILAGCSGGFSANDVDVAGLSFEEFAARTYREPSGVYIVDGDTPIDTVEKLRQFYEDHVRSGKLAIYNIGGVDIRWDNVQRFNLSYCVSTAFGGNYGAVVQAMAQAASDWEVSTDVRFVHRADQDGSCSAANNNVLFNVSPTSGQPYLARAFFPDATRANRNVLIDGTAFGASWSLAGILRHELGHVLGFRHEHTRPEAAACFEDNNWRALTPYDSASVMHYPQCRGTNSGDLVLTQRDRDGAASVYGLPPPYVGVIPAVNGCPASAQEVRLHMDNEDTNQQSSVSGWVGGTQVNSSGNTLFVFCRMDGAQFRSLASTSSGRSNYAVLRLNGRCPTGSVPFSRYFDNEDRNNANSWSGVIWPSTMNSYGTEMQFCLFKGDGSVASGLPALGFDYGVFAESTFGFAAGTGSIYTDDEDNDNANRYSADPAWKTAAVRIVSEGGNTTLRTARRGNPVCGDGACNGIENTTTCPSDCELCGNGICRKSETVYNCPQDCAYCGDGICSVGENCATDCGSSCEPYLTEDGRIICP
jgi:hypothetical protein